MSYDDVNGVYDPDDVGLGQSPLLRPIKVSIEPEYDPSAGISGMRSQSPPLSRRAKIDARRAEAAIYYQGQNGADQGGLDEWPLCESSISSEDDFKDESVTVNSQMNDPAPVDLPSISVQLGDLFLHRDELPPIRPQSLSLEHAALITPRTTDIVTTSGSFHGRSIEFSCTYPGCTAQPFQTQYLLNSHFNMHSSSRPFYCSVKGCSRSEDGKGFEKRKEMIRHELVHQSPRYICPFCPDRENKFRRADNLQRLVVKQSHSCV